MYFFTAKKALAKVQYMWGIIGVIILITFFVGTPLSQLDKFTFSSLMKKLTPVPTVTTHTTSLQQTEEKANPITGEFGGSDSGKIRLFVWKGALEAWKHNMLFGTGVETFAFAYYLYRPAGHNLTSEWDYLYNKAHNEYLNYLATTGIFGLGSYLAFICLFLVLVLKKLKLHMSYLSMTAQNEKRDKKLPNLNHIFELSIVSISLITSFLTILISNFFGFSVVIVNMYFFLIPAFFLIFIEQLSPTQSLTFPQKTSDQQLTVNVGQWLGISVIWLIGIYFLAILVNYWNADKAYGLGFNLDRAGQYQNAYEPLHQAVAARPEEPVFKDELTVNDAALAISFATQKDATSTAKLANEAVQISNELAANHPNDIVFFKTRTRVMYTLSEIDSRYLPYALDAIQKTHALAPTDAKVSYNLGLLYSQANQVDKAIEVLKQTIRLKPDYRDAYYALGTLLHQQAVDKNNTIINPEKEKEAVTYMHFILNVLAPDDKQTKDSLKSWTNSSSQS